MGSTLRAAIKSLPLIGSMAVRFRRRWFPPVAPISPSLPAGLMLNQQYDEQTVHVMKRVMSPDSTGIDVGAHEGAILRELIQTAPLGVHYAFEPIPALAEKLRQRFPGVRHHQCALSAQRGEASFLHVVNDPGYSGLQLRDYDRPDPQFDRITVATETLDHVVPDGVPVRFIKIDVEGGEYDVMLGGARLIQQARPVIVFEAAARSTGMYGVSPDQLFDLITERFGMELSTMDRWLHGRNPYRREEFAENWRIGPEFYFIASPSR